MGPHNFWPETRWSKYHEEGRFKVKQIDDFAEAYIECALWSEFDDKGDPLDKNYTREDIEYDTLQKMIEDCNKFQQDNEDLLEDLDPERCGHDFWLTRNRHGAGFWDRENLTDSQREKLTKASHEFKEYNLYVGDDGKIYGD